MYGTVYNENLPYRQAVRLIDQLEAWRQLLSLPALEPGDFFTNPLRADSYPSCYLRRHRDTYLLTDFSFPEYNKYTVFHTLAHLKGIKLRASANILLQQQRNNFKGFHINIGKIITGGRKILTEGGADLRFETFLDVHGKPTFRRIDKSFWKKRNIEPQDLISPPTYSVHHYFLNNREIYPDTYPCFAYYFPEDGSTKLYCPNNPKKKRFPASTTSTNHIWKWESTTGNTDFCIITKSYKDGIGLYKALGTRVTIYALQNEGCSLSETFRNTICNRFGLILILFDNDFPGVSNSYKLSSTISCSESIFYPIHLGKDTDDLIVAGHTNFVRSFIRSNVQRLL